MSIWWSLNLRRETASVPLARRLLLGAMETAGVRADVAYELSLALSEACANAVEHGVAGHSGTADGSDQYRVTAYLDGDMCRIEVSDHGPGFPALKATIGTASEVTTGPAEAGPGATPTPESTGAADPIDSAAYEVVTGEPAAPPAVPPAFHALSPLAQATELPGLGEAPGLLPPLEPECGRGMYLIAALSDHARFDNVPGDGAVVSFDKMLKWREDALLPA